MVEFVNLKNSKLQFKNLISGPAPVGRILNYLILSGNGKLYHKNGNRKIHLENNIACAWCSEFMKGLGLVNFAQSSKNGIQKINLTESGQKLYSMISKYGPNFSEDNNSIICLKELTTFSIDAYNLFLQIFKNSPVCQNLCAYILHNSTETFSKAKFVDDYYEFFLNLYEEGKYDRSTRTPTGKNRVPSLIQICQFFSAIEIKKYTLTFLLKKLILNEKNGYIKLTAKKIQKIKEDELANEIKINELEKKYGIDGNVAREIITRNSYVQKVFRHNLLIEFKNACALCNKNIDEILVASHIVPASKSNVYDKCDQNNGLLLCKLHDGLFDSYLITFDAESGLLKYSPILSNVLEEYGLSKNMYLPAKYLTKKRKENLKKHNSKFFEKNPNVKH